MPRDASSRGPPRRACNPDPPACPPARFVYLWSKQNPQAPVSFFGVIKMTGLYLPFVFLLLEMVQGGGERHRLLCCRASAWSQEHAVALTDSSPWNTEVYPSMAGILIGHMYYFLTGEGPQDASGKPLQYIGAALRASWLACCAHPDARYTDVYPRASGRTLIYTPQWLARSVHRAGLGQVPLAAVGPRPHPSDSRFRAFAGRGRRLAD